MLVNLFVFDFKIVNISTLAVLYPEAKAGWRAELNIKEVLEKRFDKISSTDPNVAANYLDIRVRLLDVLREAEVKNII